MFESDVRCKNLWQTLATKNTKYLPKVKADFIESCTEVELMNDLDHKDLRLALRRILQEEFNIELGFFHLIGSL